ncbi:MAG: adenylyl-sulfate kinase [Magnetococcales bacterium]|nr:adenylyl-sulfate kinase [Magnetococcales bacterium]
MVIWLIGLSGAGKSTLAEALYARLKPTCSNLVLLDGDVVRELFGSDADHTVAGRLINARRLSHLSRMLDRQGIHIIAAVLSIFPEWQAWNREQFSNYHEIFLDIPMEILKKRDTKGLYKGAAAGTIPNVVGVDIPFPRPPQPDLVVDDVCQAQGVDHCLEQILASLPTFADKCEK